MHPVILGTSSGVSGFEDPVIQLTVPAVPTITADTSLISETPIGETVDLTVPAVPTVTPDTLLKYSVIYDGNGSDGGAVPEDTDYYESGATVTVLSEGTLTKTDNTFSAWNTAANGSGTSYDPTDTFTITEVTTLYAQWTAV